MIRQFRRLDFDEIGFHVLDDSIANCLGQELRHTGMNGSGRGKRPTLGGLSPHDFGDVFSELLADALVVFGLKGGAFRDRVGVPAVAVADRETPSLIGQFGIVAAVRVGDVERLDEV